MTEHQPVIAPSERYALSNGDAVELKMMVLMPVDERLKLLRRYRRKHGQTALDNLVAQFMGLANSVTANTRDFAWEVAITQGGMDPNAAEKLNHPTIFGALQGVPLANAINQTKTCAGCAYRLGTHANQSPATTIDAADCAENSTDFLCHLPADGGEPKHVCRGHAQVMAAIERQSSPTHPMSESQA